MGIAENFDLFESQEIAVAIEKSGPLAKGFNAGDSVDDKLFATKEAIKRQLLAGKHLVVATSFGKDSSILTMLALQALEEFVAEHGSAPTMFVITSNTLIENPKMDRFSRGEARKVREYAKAKGLPVEVRIASPSVSENYIVNIIGGRVVASTPDNGRACTVSLKIRPIERLKKRLARQLGYKGKDCRDMFVTVIGKRYDESDERARNMENNGERPDQPIKMFKDKSGKDYEWLMSPIAAMTLDDIYFAIAYVRNEMIETYSDFEALVDIYRESNSGECMVNVYSKGKPGRTACGARTGCWTCTSVGLDRSMENMLNEPENAFMKGLNDFRTFLLAGHYKLENRNWLSRRVNDDGTIVLAPQGYSPKFCLELLRYALTIDAEEREAAEELGINPRFQILSVEDLVAIDFMWARYGYQHGMMACYTARQVENGKRWPVPAVTDYDPSLRLKKVRKLTLPFADEDFGHFSNDMFDPELAAADLDPFEVPTDAEFTVDPEGVMNFWEFEVDRALEQFGPIDIDGCRHDDERAPSAVVNYFLRLGTVRVAKGFAGELGRMLQMSNQIHRHGIRESLNDPQALKAALAGRGAVLPAQGQQFDVEDTIVAWD